jgi:pheromone shutdown protein TraB
LKGWYRNRVTRVVLTFMLTNLGSMLGLWLTTFKVWGKVAG